MMAFSASQLWEGNNRFLLLAAENWQTDDLTRTTFSFCCLTIN